MKNFSKVLIFMFIFSLVIGESSLLMAQNDAPDIKALKKLTNKIYPESQKNELSLGDYVWKTKIGPKQVKDPFTYKEYSRIIYSVSKVTKRAVSRKLISPAREARWREARDAQLEDKTFTVVKEEDVSIHTDPKVVKGGYFLVIKKRKDIPKQYRWEYRKK